MGIIKILKKIKRKFFKPKQDINLDRLIRDEIIKVGNNCRLSSSNFLIIDKIPGNTVIEIGNNVCLNGALLISYTSKSKIVIKDNVYVGPNTTLECAKSITVLSNVLISSNCSIIDTNSHSLDLNERAHDINDWQIGLNAKNWSCVKSSPVIIEEHCWIGLRSIITKGVTLAYGTIVGSGSVVTKSTSKLDVVAGNPAKFIKSATD